jgi:hypothetical protein
MKPTKEILSLIQKRKKYGHLANYYDAKVQNWCQEHGVDCTALNSDYGCMLTTEPQNYADKTIKVIEDC